MSGSFMDELEDAKDEWGEGSNRWILPKSSLDRLITPQKVGEELISSFPTMDKAILEDYAIKICRTEKSLKRTFAVLSCRWGNKPECCKTIQALVDEGISDSDLPFERVHATEHSQNDQGPRKRDLLPVLYVKDRALCPKSNHSDCNIKAFGDWSRKNIEDFSRDQWMVLSPEFRKEDGQQPHYDLDDRTHMPFKEDFERDEFSKLREGGYSEVWPVRMFTGHQDLYQLPNRQEEPLLAVKRLKSTITQHFEKEAYMLRALAEKKHLHLVRLLATYKYNGKYHFLFPFAKDNLKTFWEATPHPKRDHGMYFWALNQMTGLASGLDMIHSFQSNLAYDQALGNPGISRLRPSANINFVVVPNEAQFGRHGDLKPENILWSNEDPSRGPRGILQITDFGLGRFHRLESRSRQDPRNIAGSATYVPPEIPLQKPVSRAYDIWSLGCMFLEFVTWLLEGQDGLVKFADQRMEKAPDGVEDDTFYTLIDGGSDAVIRSGVQQWIQRLRGNPQCSDMLNDLLQLLQNDLLVVKPGSRINAQELYERLKGMEVKSQDTSNGPRYLMGWTS